jgi:signal transduction histidine kinase
MTLADVFHWFSGGRPGYMSLLHCMHGDTFWIAATVLLDLAVAGGYVMIALHWRLNERRLPDGPSKRALGSMKTIFIFCGLCGYVFIPVKMIWPAWRLYDLFLAVLVYYTWRYAWGARELKVVYNELGRSVQLAQELQESRADSQRKSFFLNAVSHDLRTPLNGLNLHAELAEIHLNANDLEGLRGSLAEIRAGAQAAGALLNHFLELGRLDYASEPIRVGPFDLSEALRRLGRSVQPQADRRGLWLRVEAPADLMVQTDREQLLRLVENLLINALKFTHSGGVTLSAGADGPDAVIVVADTGSGIDPEHLGHIFEEFYQVQNAERDRSKGFGLGLAIARRLAVHLGGDLAVESEPGRGSRFSLTLRGAVGGAPNRPSLVGKAGAS